MFKSQFAIAHKVQNIPKNLIIRVLICLSLMGEPLKRNDEQLITIISVINVIIAIIVKGIVYFLSKSLILYGEFVDSLSDIAVVLITYISLRESSKPADLKHMFGHYKINSFAALIQGTILSLLYLDVGYKAIMKLITQPFEVPPRSVYGFWALIFLTATSLVTASIVIRIGRKKKNLLIIAQGENFKGDYLRNIAQILGLLLVAYGLGIFDPIFALIFSIRAIFIGLKIAKQSYFELTDSANFLQDDIEKLEKKIRESCVPEVYSVKVRTLGNSIDLFVEFAAGGQVELLHHTTDVCLSNIMKEMFPDYKSNIIIDYRSETAENNDTSEKTIEKIKEIGVKYGNEYELHNISIDRFTDGVIVKIHLKVDPSLTLEESIKKTDDLRDEIVESIKEIMKVSNIECIRHIEPKFREIRVHKHQIDESNTDSIKQIVETIIKQNKEILGVKRMNLQIESNGVYIFLKIYLDPKIKIAEVHRIMDLLENNLRCLIHNLAECSIQAVPFEENSKGI